MSSNENTHWEPGALAQIKKNVQGAGELGVVIGPTAGVLWHSSGCLDILFGEGMRRVHPSNLQVPDGRTRRLDSPPR